MKIEFTDPNPKISKHLEKELLSNKERLKIIIGLKEKGIVDYMEEQPHHPPYYIVNLNHYGGQAFVSQKGTVMGHVMEYQEKGEITDEDRQIIDKKLA